VKAEIFELGSQQKLGWEIETLLRSLVYRNIQVEHKIHADDKLVDRPDLGWRRRRVAEASERVGELYLDVLRAAMSKVKDFSVEVETAQGTWGYWEYYVGGELVVRLHHDAKLCVFPSVALMGRMVMVPQGIHEAFDAPSDFTYVMRPLRLHGVLVVDFQDKEAIRRAVETVGREIREEVVLLARRHMSARRIRRPDVEELGRLLNVHEEFLNALGEEVLTPSPHLLPTVASGPVQLERLCRVRLEIRNESGEISGDVRVRVRAPWNVMKPYARYLDGKAEVQTIEFEVTPKTGPYCPLEILFLFDETARAATVPIPVLLDVVDEDEPTDDR